MAMIVDVKFSPNGRVYRYDRGDFITLKKGDSIIVEYNDCKEWADVCDVRQDDKKIPMYSGNILRLITPDDQKQKKESEKKSQNAYPKVLESIKKFELLMKLVEVKYSFDCTKLFISYIAENRVDFRELVKHLASIFKTRVELRQISTREEARLYGGCGPCGKELCCQRFSNETKQVTIKMAKTQGLALSPSKINGVCGKLLCCLAYEYPEYQEVLDKMPALGENVKTSKGEGVVIFQDLLNEKITIKIGDDDDFKNEDIKLDEIIKD